MTWPHRLFTGEISDYELKLLKVFRTITERGGFSMAEVELGASKSAISKQMTDLELRLGVRLCSRGRSGFSLTPDGEKVYAAATQLFASLEVFRSELNDILGDISGTLYLGIIDTLVTQANSSLHRAIARYTAEHRGVSLKIISASAPEIRRSVQDMRLHVGITVMESSLDNTVSIPLFDEVSNLYCGARHPLFEVTDLDLTPELIADFPFVQHGYSEAERLLAEKFKLAPKSISHVTEGVLFLILSGQYLGFLPTHYADLWEKRGEIKPILARHINKRTTVTAIAHQRISGNAIIKNFLDQLSGGKA